MALGSPPALLGRSHARALPRGVTICASLYPECRMLTEAPASTDLKSLASDVLTQALKAGASDAEVVVHEGEEFSTLVRLGQVEQLKESGSRAIGLRVFLGQKTA